MTLGRGRKNSSTKHNIVTKISTEAEIVAVSDGLGENLRLMYLMQDQGYDIKPVVLYQYNKSAITLMKKGRSTSRRTKHISVRYFFVKDRLDKEEVKLVYPSTDDMLADFYTKPLQWSLFRRMRDMIVGLTQFVKL